MKQISTEKKAAIAADFASGESVQQIARTHGVSPSTALKYARQTPAIVSSTNGSGASDPEILDLTSLVGKLLAAKLETAIAIQEHVRNPKWLMQQTAGDLAVLIGVNFDKMGRMLDHLAPRDKPS